MNFPPSFSKMIISSSFPPFSSSPFPYVFETKTQNFHIPPSFLENPGGGMGGMNSVTGGMGMGLDRMSSSFDRMGPGIGAILERSIDMDRGFLSGPMGSGMRERIGSKGNQIFVRNVSK